MGIEGMSKDEETKIFKAVWEFQTNGVTEELCPRCNGKQNLLEICHPLVYSAKINAV